MQFGRSLCTRVTESINQSLFLEKISSLPYWAFIAFSNLAISLFTRITHEPDRLSGEYSHIDPYLYTAYINNFQDMTDRFGKGWYYNSRIAGILPEAILRYLFGNTLGSHLTIFLGLSLLSISLILICNKLEISRVRLFYINLIVSLSPLLLYEFGQDYPSLWSNIWGFLGFSLLIYSRYKTFLAAGFFFSLAINSWESYIYVVAILVASYYLALPIKLKLRTKMHSMFLILSGGVLSQLFLSLCMFIYRGLDIESIFFQKTTWNWIVSFYKLETTVYDVEWSLLGTKTIVVLLLFLPLVVFYISQVDRYKNRKPRLTFISKLAMYSTSLTSLYLIYNMSFNANISLAALYYLSPVIFPLLCVVILCFSSNLQSFDIRKIAFIFLLINILNFNPLFELLLSSIYLFVGQKRLNERLTSITQTRILSLGTIMLLGFAPTLDVKNTSQNFSTCILSLNCSASDSKLKVANEFQDWYVSKYIKNQQFYIHAIPDTNLEEDLVFRVIATGVFSFTYLPDLEGREFTTLTFLEFEKYLSGRKNVVLLSGNRNSLESIRNGFLSRDFKFKVSAIDEISSGGIKIYVSRVGI
jgi:hypothetical protein